ncbi:MAG: hypothetical protein ABIH21_02220 [Patescibacteria group bacterium]
MGTRKATNEKFAKKRIKQLANNRKKKAIRFAKAATKTSAK